MYAALCNLLSGGEFSVIESFEVPEQPARFSAIPQFLFNSRIGPYLNQQFSGPGGLWAHQAQSLEALGRGENTVVSTGTRVR